MKTLLILWVMAAAGFASDEPAPIPAGSVLRLFTLKYADADQLRKLFSSFSYPMSTNRSLNTLAVTAPASFLTKVEAAVKELDVAPAPQKNIELTIYLLAGAAGPSATPLPKELQEMEKQLIESSSFKAYRLADSQVIRTRPGQPGGSTGALDLTQIRFRAAWIKTSEKSNTISIDGLHVQLKSTVIDEDIDMREGQLVVIGKDNPGGLLLAIAKVSE